MKVKYDKKEDAVWIEFAKGTYDKTRKVSDSILVDEDSKGKVLGIEILDASINILDFDPNGINISLQSS
jgi:uncharacterized protein YuzE